jgi:hypothetical protein
LRVRRAILAVLPSVFPALTVWKTLDSIALIDVWRERLRLISGEHWRALYMSCEVSPAALLIEREVRDFAAESLRDGRRRRADNECPIYRREYVSIARIPCRALYYGELPGTRIQNIVNALLKAQSLLGGDTETMVTRDLKDRTDLVRDAVDQAYNIERDFAKIPASLEVENIDGIVRWLNLQPKDWRNEATFRRDGRHIMRQMAYGKPVIMQIPIATPILCPPELHQLKAALTGTVPDEPGAETPATAVADATPRASGLS